MSYFIGHDGVRYYPFGVGGKEKLFKGLGIITDDTDIASSIEILHRTPYFNVPFSDILSEKDIGEIDSTPLSKLDTPVVLRKPMSDAAHVYQDICTNLIDSLFKIIIAQQQVNNSYIF